MKTLIHVEIIEPNNVTTFEEALEKASRQRDVVHHNFLKQGFDYWFTDHNMEYWKREDGIATICQ